MTISIKVIDHNTQRYNTVGDWQRDPKTGDITIQVSKMSDPRFEILVGVHELIEVIMCRWDPHEPVGQRTVDEFDMGLPANIDREPGDIHDCPYQFQHGFATAVERMLAAAMRVRWADYETEVEYLYANYKPAA